MQIGPDIPAAAKPTLTNLSGSEKSFRNIVTELYPVEHYRSRDEVNADDASLQAFTEALRSKGALRFFVEFNLEKIEEMVEKYRDELEAYAEENPGMQMDISRMVSDYRKQLMEQYMSAQDDEKAQILHPAQAFSELLLQKRERAFIIEKTPFESLLDAKKDGDDSAVLI